jgi:hypothetical protein
MAWGEALLLAGPSAILIMRARENVLKYLELIGAVAQYVWMMLKLEIQGRAKTMARSHQVTCFEHLEISAK